MKQGLQLHVPVFHPRMKRSNSTRLTNRTALNKQVKENRIGDCVQCWQARSSNVTSRLTALTSFHQAMSIGKYIAVFVNGIVRGFMRRL
ncbi:hypothetical protein [Roseinatronobacter sp. S2]|uniref:hypothetical protein n=1 Tax=Roseinatronobacter sp. S2 TaxID=3035471 RepID=UPI0024107DDC|nr:hypothetical protein [Roseinatronobacter sp. S2]WFE74020.1 hypothetical protein P8S53_12625 [Roseinatronobacter sp. S2]